MKTNLFLLGFIASILNTLTAFGDGKDHWFEVTNSFALQDLSLPTEAVVLELGRREVELIACDGFDPMNATAGNIYYLSNKNGDGIHWIKLGGPSNEIYDSTVIDPFNHTFFVIRDRQGSLDISNISEDVSYLGNYEINGRPGDETFSLIPAGTFTMGSPNSELGRIFSEETQHEVTLPQAFYIGRTEVTWTQWNTTRDEATAFGYTDINLGRNGNKGDASGQHPVTEVSWWDAIKWCNLRSELEGLNPVYYTTANFDDDTILRIGTTTPFANWSANGYRLPTEAEWEYASRANESAAFATGDITYIGLTPLDPNLDKTGWYGGNSGSNTHPVGKKEPNNWGLRDMHGNVWEWCWDWYGENRDDAIAPKGETSGSHRISRGGSWVDPALCCRSALRDLYTPTHLFNSFGFRIVRNSNP